MAVPPSCGLRRLPPAPATPSPAASFPLSSSLLCLPIPAQPQLHTSAQRSFQNAGPPVTVPMVSPPHLSATSSFPTSPTTFLLLMPLGSTRQPPPFLEGCPWLLIPIFPCGLVSGSFWAFSMSPGGKMPQGPGLSSLFMSHFLGGPPSALGDPRPPSSHLTPDRHCRRPHRALELDRARLRPYTLTISLLPSCPS